MPLLKPFIILLAASWLSACASRGPEMIYNDNFETDITADGTKFFIYTRHFHKKPSGDDRPLDEQQADAALRRAVQEKLNATSYCRDGYLTLEDYEANGIARIRGECRDGASDDDRKQFPNRH